MRLDDWRALLAAVEAATGPNYELERRVADLTGTAQYLPRVPAVTASLDAVTALIEREMPEKAHQLLEEMIHTLFEQSRDPYAQLPMMRAPLTAGLALALLAAFIRATIVQLEQSEHAA